MRPVTSKHDFVKRYALGEFGNSAPTWNSLEDFFVSHAAMCDEQRLYHVRNRIPGGKTYYNKTYREIVMTSFTELDTVYVSEMAPTDKTLIQGECCRVPGGLFLTYSRVRRPMREAFAYVTQKQIGLKARMILQKVMDNNSWEWLNYLLDEYDDHIIEFSTYSTQWGTQPGYNTIFWEVRPNRAVGSNLSSFTEIY